MVWIAVYCCFVLIMSTVTFFVMAYDKKQAKLKKRRVSEKTLFTLGFFGGAFGQWLSMSVFRHKTKHVQFVLGIPFFAMIHLGAGIYLFYTLYKGGFL